jgi:DNA-binding NarL/FixJ family response regulator
MGWPFVTTLKKALVIDDHPLVARGIGGFLSSHCNFDDVREVTNIDEVWRSIDVADPPSLIVLDFWLSNNVSLQLLAELKMKLPSTPILVMSADGDMVVQQKVFAAGAHGFIHKQEPVTAFVEVVYKLLSGKKCFEGLTKESLSTDLPKELSVTAFELGLTDRQGEILGMILKGFPNKRIAQQLSISEQTVKEHVSGILSRLGVGNRIEIITKLRGKRLE